MPRAPPPRGGGGGCALNQIRSLIGSARLQADIGNVRQGQQGAIGSGNAQSAQFIEIAQVAVRLQDQVAFVDDQGAAGDGLVGSVDALGTAFGY